MQHTEKYKLNLIERDDPFSPEALNENAQKTEAALAGEEAVRTAQTAALDRRVTTLEVHKAVIGTYAGTNEEQIIELGFTPTALFVYDFNNSKTVLAITDCPVGRGLDPDIKIVEGGFRLRAGVYGSPAVFNYGSPFYYLAIV